MLPHMPSLPSHTRSFEPGMPVQQVVSPSIVAEGNLSDDGTYSLNGSANPIPKLMGQPYATNVQADGSQEIGSFVPAQSLMSSASQPTYLNSIAPTTNFPSKSFGNMSTWMLQPPNLQVLPGKPNAHVTPGSPGIPSSVSYPNSTIQVSSIDSTAVLRNYAPTGPILSAPSIQYNALRIYPSPSPQAPSPGQWLQPQQMSGFPRPPFSAYGTATPGLYPIPTYTRPPSASLPDVQPPGVSLVVSAVGASSSSVVGSQSSTSCGQEDQPPVTDNSKYVSNQILDEAPKNEKMDVWTAHSTGTGTVYYYNALTGQSTYEKPSGFKGETDKAATQSIPVSWDKLTGTDWMQVNMNDGKRYYYNTITKLSSWQMPIEVAELGKKQDSQASGAYSAPAVKTNVVTEKGSDPFSLSTPAANTGGRDATVIRSSSVSGSSSALDLIKRKLQDSGLPDSTSPGSSSSGAMALELNGRKPAEVTIKNRQSENSEDKHKDGDGEADVSNSSSDSEEEDGGPMKEECILKFKEMLKERGVAPFSKWDKELPKIVFDPRFKAISDHGARRTLFEHYVRTRAEEERKEKRAALRAALDGFKQLLEEAKEDIDHNTDYQTFKKKWGEDPKFQALDRKEKELLLNERVFPLKRVVQERAQAERAAAVSDFKSMLRDKLDMISISRWSKVKDSLKSDSRYKSVRHEDREKLFNEYINEIKVAEEAARKAKPTEDNEDKLKERQRVLQKRKEREEQEVERVRQKARRKEAVESYQALLVETIKDPQASWTESKPKLDKDPQGRGANPHLDISDMEKLFREHAKTLYERCVLEFRASLAEVITVESAAQETEDGKTIFSSWSTAKQLLKNDPRYNRMPRKERESLWYRHVEEIHRRQQKVNDQEDKVEDGKSGNPVNSGKRVSGSRRQHDRR